VVHALHARGIANLSSPHLAYRYREGGAECASAARRCPDKSRRPGGTASRGTDARTGKRRTYTGHRGPLCQRAYRTPLARNGEAPVGCPKSG
jgi:hypothetical protein